MGKWTNHPTGNDRVQDIMCEIKAGIIHSYNFFKEMDKRGYTCLCENCVPQDEISKAMKVADDSLNCKNLDDLIKEIIKKDGIEPAFDYVNEISLEYLENLKKGLTTSDAEKLIAVTFVLLECKVRIVEDGYYEHMYQMLSIAKEVILADEENKEKEEYIRVLQKFLDKWEYIIDTYVDNEETYSVICGTNLCDSLHIKMGNVDIEQMKKEVHLYELLGIM